MSSGTGNSLAMLPFFPRDYLAATRHMSLAERGAYTDLLWLQWENGPLPEDPARLARLVGCGAAEFAPIWEAIRDKFIEVDGSLINVRLEEHRSESMRRSASASASAKVRWERVKAARASLNHANAYAPAPANAMPAHSERNAGEHANGHAKSMLPSPSPSPSPDSGVSFGDSHPPTQPARTKPAYHAQEFHQQVIDAYHELLSSLPAVKVWSKKRAGALNARITESLGRGKPADQVTYWRSVFKTVADSPHLLGENDRAWTADLEWLLRPENFAKVIEGRYLKRQRTALASGVQP